MPQFQYLNNIKLTDMLAYRIQTQLFLHIHFNLFDDGKHIFLLSFQIEYWVSDWSRLLNFSHRSTDEVK